MLIRHFQPSDAPALRAVFHDSIHGLASANYSAAQLDAWAPAEHDTDGWLRRMEAIAPLVAEIEGEPAGFADLQTDGYIDMFFVSPRHARRGVGTALMRRLLDAAREAALASIYSNVSLTAEPFFAGHGFTVERRNEVAVRGAVLRNATMRRRLVETRSLD
ncbi:GNAT family N-acetyltransferase [Massilia pseudoviolaceinigra]|uniref:GNAT family N-acetyltransferase n=1 Tax=Massilia pseudoviolaceinigra TaxID=3057165 RepID=UPI00279663B3|nr:GNAT family N-acetyltransferase [Massilia sp. CCM 9206]MDQ1922912.1 GNAT family N-acetyltransferase [Massilia sp. CCM 9206]